VGIFNKKRFSSRKKGHREEEEEGEFVQHEEDFSEKHSADRSQLSIFNSFALSPTNQAVVVVVV
jgi:hypothetical protein